MDGWRSGEPRRGWRAVAHYRSVTVWPEHKWAGTMASWRHVLLIHSHPCWLPTNEISQLVSMHVVDKTRAHDKPVRHATPRLQTLLNMTN